MQPVDTSLLPFFSPKGIAVIGASQNPLKLGYGLARNLVQGNYQGVVHFVNPKGGSLLGRPVFLQISQVPDPVDLAILLIPARAVPGALEECAQRGIHAAVIASGGFRETGPQGARLEEECLQIARQHAIRLLGPNCIGLLDTHLPLDATFLPSSRTAARRCGIHLPFRGNLCSCHRLGARSGIRALAIGQPGKPGGCERDRCAGPRGR